MRFILCVKIDLLLDGWTDLHEILGVDIVRPGLLHEVHFDSNVSDEKKIQFCSVSSILLFEYFHLGPPVWEEIDFEHIK